MVEALRVLRSLLPGELSTALAIAGSGRYDDPWVIPIFDETTDPSEGVTSVDALVWLDPGRAAGEVDRLIAQAADEVSDGDLLARFLAEAAAFRPQLAASLRGRAPDAVARRAGRVARRQRRPGAAGLAAARRLGARRHGGHAARAAAGIRP